MYAVSVPLSLTLPLKGGPDTSGSPSKGESGREGEVGGVNAVEGVLHRARAGDGDHRWRLGQHPREHQGVRRRADTDRHWLQIRTAESIVPITTPDVIASRKNGLSRFWTLVIGTIDSAVRIWSTETLERPTQRIFPS